MDSNSLKDLTAKSASAVKGSAVGGWDLKANVKAGYEGRGHEEAGGEAYRAART